jgi:immune inhibitor A
MNHRVLARLIFCSMMLLATAAMAQMPPHPQLLDNIQKGVVPMPSVLEDVATLRARGIDAPWSAPAPANRTQSATPRSSNRLFGPLAPPSGSFKALAILVTFSDKPAQVTASYFDSLLFVQKPGSMRDYYKAVSYGSLDIITVNMPSSLGWYNAPRAYSYYVNGNYGMGAYPKNSQKLVEDVVAIADSAVDFSKYDNDGDGYVDALFIIHAGQGAEFTGATTDMWSHAWATQNVPHVDGVSVLHYSVEPEYWQGLRDMTIGVFAHELGHAAFGLPDLYDRDYTSEGLGRWSLMAGGSWNGPAPGGASPALPDAWSHIQMGFIAPTVVGASINRQAIQAVESAAQSFILAQNGTVGSEYYLVENRQRTGYDSYLPGDGLLVYHVDESVATQNDDEWYPGNTAGSHYFVALEQADGNYQLERNANSGDNNDPFPGSTGNSSFAVDTKPGSMNYGLQASGVSILNISASAAVMTADFNVTATDAGLVLLSPYGGEVFKGGSSQQISWAALNYAGDITIDYSTDDGATWKPISTISGASHGSTSSTTLVIDAEKGESSVASAPGTAVSVDAVAGYTWIVPEIASVHCRVRVASVQNPSVHDISHGSFTLVPTTGQWSIQFNWDANSVTGAGGNAGAVYIPTLSEFWTSRWNSNLIYRWTRNGSLIGSFAVSGVSGVRGLTYDGARVYASTASTTITILDPATQAKVGTITSPVAARYVAYDPTADGGNGGLWVGDYFTDPTLITLAGATLRTLSYSSLGSATNYSIAFDNVSAGGPYLWFWGQGNGGGTPQVLVQVSVATGLPTGVTHDVAIDAGQGVSTPLAGGMFFTTGIVVGKATLGGLLQGAPNRLFGYEIADAPLPIQLATFTGSYLSENVAKLTWMTLSEVDNYGFEVQKSLDSTFNFVTIENSFVAGNGTTVDRHYYSFIDSSSTPSSYYRLMQLDRSGAVHYSEAIKPTAATGITEQAVPAGYALSQNYPNPFNPTTGIRFQVPGVSNVKITVYDMLGKEVAVLVNEKKSAGTYEVRFDGAGLATGMYIYRLVAGQYVETKRMLLVK